MKPASFSYHAPSTVGETLELVQELGDDAKVLAGGQSLVPMMNFRLATPAHLIDLNGVTELDELEVGESGGLTVGAMTRQRTLERSPEVRRLWPLLPEAIGFIGHAQIRNRGTVGGSLVHNDPSAELPAVMTALDATFRIAGPAGVRTARPEEFFVDYMTTSLDVAELLTAIDVPALPARTGWSFQEVSRRHGDFALVAAAALLTLDASGLVAQARIVLSGVGSGPVVATDAQSLLVGHRPAPERFAAAAKAAVANLAPDSDLHADGNYRTDVGAVLVRRSLARAAERAEGIPA
jgi:CO/xanthine dehydrogenase FAD-binding subunit